MSLNNFRKGIDGSLFAPKRGKPPEEPLGYIRDSTNPFRFLPCADTNPKCMYLYEDFMNTGCCGVKLVKRCKLKGKPVTFADCKDCTLA